MTDDEVIAGVLAAEAARLEAIEGRDFDRLASLLGEDLSYVHSDYGTYEDKATYLETVRTSPRSYVRENLVVRPFGEIAVMNGEIHITVDALADGTPARHLVSLATQVWAWREQRWQMIAFQATMIANRN